MSGVDRSAGARLRRIAEMKKGTFRASATAAGLIAVAVGTMPNATQAQDTAQANGNTGVETVMVTAEKRTENIQDVPESVTAIQAEPLVRDGQVLLRDYYTQIPGFSVSPNINADQVLS